MTHTKEQPTKSLVWFEDGDAVASISIYHDVAFMGFYGVKEAHCKSIPLHLVDAYAERLTFLFGAYNLSQR